LSEAVLAHGGVAGAIAEGAVALAVVGLFAAIWLRERSARRVDDEPDEGSQLTGRGRE
jgi:hypothetical protein